jgi:cyd operon protein YbgT
MWYFSWILGVLLACSLGIINVLRLEAQEALAKENEVVDPLTRLLTRESMLQRLREKVDNSKRNGLPFSVVFLSLRDFRSLYALPDHELDATLLKVVDKMRQDIRIGVDLAARISDEEFVLALPGAQIDRAQKIAEKIRIDIHEGVKTPSNIAVEIKIGVVEYSRYMNEFQQDNLVGIEEAEALMRVALGKCFAENKKTA